VTTRYVGRISPRPLTRSSSISSRNKAPSPSAALRRR
jgi:hypothetical protein